MTKGRRAVRLWNRLIPLLMAAVVLLGCLDGLGLRARAEESPVSLQPYNIVLLIDKSGSMNTTDEQRLAVSAAGMFVNSLYTKSMLSEVASGGDEHSKIGVISFSADAKTETAPIELTSENEVSFLTSKIDSIVYDKVNTGATDLGRAVLAGTDMLQANQDDVRKNMIILFTDGYTDALSPEGLQRSSAMMAEGLEAARQMNCEIYVVGLNYQGRISDEGRAEIWNIANSTQTSAGLMLPDSADTSAGTRVNYLITDSRQEVNDFYTDIFSMMMGSEGTTLPPIQKDGWTYYNIDLSDEGIFCANIYVVSDTGIGELTLADPSGNAVDLNSDNIRFVRGNGYAMITIMAPATGTWVMGTEGQVDYNVTLVPVTGIILQMDANISGGSAYLTVQALYKGTPQSADFYAGLSSASCVVTPEAGGDSQSFDLTYSETAGALTGQITVPTPGRYVVETSVSAAQMVRSDVQTLEFTMEGSPLLVTVPQKKQVDLDVRQRYFANWDNIALTIQDVSWEPENLVDIQTGEGNLLTVRGLRQGEAAFTVLAVDSLGQEWEIPGTIKVTFNILVYLPFILIGLVVLIFLLRYWIKHNRRLPGDFTITCTCEGSFNAESLPPLRGESFSLYDLVLASLNPDSPRPEMQHLVKVVKEAQKELSSQRYRIHIVTRRSGKSKYKTYRYGNGHLALGGEIYRNDDTGLIIEVDFRRLDEDDDY